MRATRASKPTSQPYSREYNSPWRCTTHPTSPGSCRRRRNGSGGAVLPEDLLYGPHRVEEPALVPLREAAEHPRYLLPRATVQLRKGVLAGGRKTQQAPPSVRLGRHPLQKPPPLEPGEDAAQVPRIQPQVPYQVRGDQPFFLRHLEQHPRLGERVGAVQKPLPENPDPARKETVEPSNVFYPRL